MRQLLELLLRPPHHVRAHRAINQDRLLHCHGHLLAEPERLDSANICSSDADDSARGIVEPLNEFKHRRLSGAAVAADPDEAAGRNRKRNALQRRALSGVIEGNVVELHRVVTQTVRGGDRIAIVVQSNRRSVVEDGANVLKLLKSVELAVVPEGCARTRTAQTEADTRRRVATQRGNQSARKQQRAVAERTREGSSERVGFRIERWWNAQHRTVGCEHVTATTCALQSIQHSSTYTRSIEYLTVLYACCRPSTCSLNARSCSAFERSAKPKRASCVPSVNTPKGMIDAKIGYTVSCSSLQMLEALYHSC